MKRFFLLVALLCMTGAPLRAENYKPTPENLQSRRQFSEDRFGIFIHWGIYSTFAQGEWYLQNGPLRREEYAKAANAFYPHAFDAKAWAKVFKKAGARYITFTTRHHDGFSMWNTQQSDYNIMHTPYGKDIVAQLAEACRENNLALHLYYSHIDWTREDYPLGRTGLHNGKDPKKANWPSYFAFMNNQLTELLTQYGAIRAVWFDGWWDQERAKPAFNWQLPEQYALIHRLQPACLIGNNHHQTPNEGEDIQLFERDVPGENKAGMSGQSVSSLPLETCETMNGMWGYKIIDQTYKSDTTLIRLLVQTAGRNANLLLNIGPEATGALPATAIDRLEKIGKWMKTYGKTVKDGVREGIIPPQEWGVSTQKGKTVYLHILDWKSRMLSLPLTEKVKSVVAYDTRRPIPFQQTKLGLTLSFDKAPSEANAIDYIVEVTLH